MTTVAALKETVAAAVRDFAAFYRANTARIAELPNAADMNAMRIELLASILRVSDHVELALVEGVNASSALVDEAATMLSTLRSRRAEIEHYLRQRPATSGAPSGGAVLAILGLAVLGAAIYAASGDQR